ncbi:TPR-like protein [Trichodelitschia bisporula]|uniref:Tetratricopeptide repeat and J domain-containing co-chaperone DNJ1 n=1 Tax=Trichodelitschia bisporula TaxID=703511 RepID=A0A6G1HVI5_9PEZI|nr:TPR-like protein [Trichodelitschia bisporula]
MILPRAAAVLLLSPLAAFALSHSDIPSDTPVAQLVKTANAQLAAGKAQEALTYFDVAIARDPQNYLTIFKRGAAYLSLGKPSQAQKDFDKVLALKPNFEGALLQRGKIRAKNGEWDAAKKDYTAMGEKGAAEIVELEEAHGAAILSADAEKSGNWDECIHQAGVAIRTASTVAELRRRRARCRFQKGEVAEGVNDLQHVLHISTGSTAPYLEISAMLFYALGETDKGLAQIRKCLQSDPDSKTCRKLMRQEKNIEKTLKKVRQAIEKRQFATAVKYLVKTSDSEGILAEIKDDVATYTAEGLIHKSSPNGLYTQIVDITCEAYVGMNNLKRGQPYCAEALALNPTSLPGLLAKAKQELAADEFEAATRTLTEAKEHHGQNEKVIELLQEAQKLLKRSKEKDYYKVLGLARDADEQEIKRAYRKLTRLFHPDKASTQGISKEEAQKKMAEINEAYEVLSDEELKARFDRGDDPNDPHGGAQHGSPFGHGADGQQFFFRSGPGGGFPGGFQFQGGGFQFPGGF